MDATQEPQLFDLLLRILVYVLTGVVVLMGRLIWLYYSWIQECKTEINVNREQFKDKIAEIERDYDKQIADIKSDLRSNSESDTRIHKDIEALREEFRSSFQELSGIVSGLSQTIQNIAIKGINNG